MTTDRTPEDLTALRTEAERRVRAGESRADVSRDLGVPLSTLATWAHEGRWRKKDIEAHRAQEISTLISETLRQEREKDQRLLAEKTEAAVQKALRKKRVIDIPPGTPAPDKIQPHMFEPDPFEIEAVAMSLAETLLRQGRLEEAGRAVRFSIRFIEAREKLEQRSHSRWKEEKQGWQAWRTATIAQTRSEDEKRDKFYAENANHMAEVLGSYAEEEQKLRTSNRRPTSRQHVETWPDDDDDDFSEGATKIDGGPPASPMPALSEDQNLRPLDPVDAGAVGGDEFGIEPHACERGGGRIEREDGGVPVGKVA